MNKAHQRIIREKKALTDSGGLFGYPDADIKKAELREVDYQTAKKIIEEYEWLGTMGTGGLFGYPDADIKKAELREVDYQTAKKIIEEYEWLGTMGTTQYHYGIYFDGVCGGVVCFGYFQAMNTNSGGHPYAPYVGEKYAKDGIQLTRGACAWWVHEQLMGESDG